MTHLDAKWRILAEEFAVDELGKPAAELMRAAFYAGASGYESVLLDLVDLEAARPPPSGGVFVAAIDAINVEFRDYAAATIAATREAIAPN